VNAALRQSHQEYCGDKQDQPDGGDSVHGGVGVSEPGPQLRQAPDKDAGRRIGVGGGCGWGLSPRRGMWRGLPCRGRRRSRRCLSRRLGAILRAWGRGRDSSRRSVTNEVEGGVGFLGFRAALARRSALRASAPLRGSAS